MEGQKGWAMWASPDIQNKLFLYYYMMKKLNLLLLFLFFKSRNLIDFFKKI